MEDWHYWTHISEELEKIQKEPDAIKQDALKENLALRLENEWSKDANFIFDRFREIGSDINILYISENILDLVKESLYSYLNGQYISTIATSGIAAEIFCSYLYQIFLEGRGFDEHDVDRLTRRFNAIGQGQKIDVLESVLQLDTQLIERIRQIKETRDHTVHPSRNPRSKRDALVSLKNLIWVLHVFSSDVGSQLQELTDETNNSDDAENPK